MNFLCFMVYIFLPTILGSVTFLTDNLFTINGLLVLQSIVYSFFTFEFIVAWNHKYLWHGPLWFLHKHHHETPSRITLDENDLLGVGNGIWIMTLTYFWEKCSRETNLYYLLGGYIIGIIAYGIIVLYMHDGLSHNRFPTIWIPFKKYLRMQSGFHLRHHNVDKNGLIKIGVAPYGFLFAKEEVRSTGHILYYMLYTGTALQLFLIFV